MQAALPGMEQKPEDEATTNGLSQEHLDRFRQFIEAYGERAHKGWSFAKTMPGIPHSYAVLDRAAAASLDREFYACVLLIRKYGYKRKPPMKNRQFVYLNIDGWRYWTMRRPDEPREAWIAETTIINREPMSREGKEQLRRDNGHVNVRWYECDAGHRWGLVVESFRQEGREPMCPACGYHAEINEVAGPQ